MTRLMVLSLTLLFSMVSESVLADPAEGCRQYFNKLRSREVFLPAVEIKAEAAPSKLQYAEVVEAVENLLAPGTQLREGLLNNSGGGKVVYDSARENLRKQLREIDQELAASTEKELARQGVKYTRYSLYLEEVGFHTHVFLIEPGQSPVGKLAERWWEDLQVGIAYAPLVNALRRGSEGFDSNRGVLFLPNRVVTHQETDHFLLRQEAAHARTYFHSRRGRPTIFTGRLVSISSDGGLKPNGHWSSMSLDSPIAYVMGLRPYAESLERLATGLEKGTTNWNQDVLPLLGTLSEHISTTTYTLAETLYHNASTALRFIRMHPDYFAYPRTLLGARQIEFLREDFIDGDKPGQKLTIRLYYDHGLSSRLDIAPQTPEMRNLLQELFQRTESDHVVMDYHIMEMRGLVPEREIPETHSLAQHPGYARLKSLLQNDSSLADAVRNYLEVDVPVQLRELVTFSAWQLDEQTFVHKRLGILRTHNATVEERATALREIAKQLRNIEGHGSLHLDPPGNH